MNFRPFLLLLAATPLLGAGVTVRFDPTSPDVGPFPTDFLTVPDSAQKTGRRVNLPLPDCQAQPDPCRELALLNQFDGFNVQPRIRVRFSAAVNPDTLREGIFFSWLGSPTPDERGLHEAGHVTRINQVIYDPPTLTAYAKPDEIFDQHRRYALIVTDAVRDATGDPVGPDPGFLFCAGPGPPNDYCGDLARAVTALAVQVAPRRIVAASLFTTMSATAWMEKARTAIGNSQLSLQPTGPRSIFALSDLASVVWRQQVGANPPAFQDAALPLPLLAGVDRVAFGSFLSPSFLDDRQTIPPAPTGANVPLPAAASEIFFEVYLPPAPKPPAGYPVVIFGHGVGDSRFGGPTAVGPTLARNGLATIAINAVGHGFGPQSKLLLTLNTGATVELPAPGRGLDLNGDGTIDSTEGCVVVPGPIPVRDCLRQTALDLMQLVRAIRAGIDLDGDGVVDLDPNRIFYAGQSLGSFCGTLFTAVEPAIAAAALNAGGGSVVETARWSPGLHSVIVAELALRSPPLLNRIFSYNENYVLRDQPVKINDVAGAIEIQNFLETLEWIEGPGNTIAYSPHLLASPLPAVAPKPVLWQFSKGDETVPNPATGNLIGAADLSAEAWFATRDIGRAPSRQFPNTTNRSVWMYRNDLARAVAPGLSANPHIYLADLTSPAATAIARAAQQQIAVFFASGGTAIPDVNNLVQPLFGRNLFEVPQSLPEDLNFGP